MDPSGNTIAQQAAAELTSLHNHYSGPKTGNTVTPDLLFRGIFKGETDGPYLSQFLLQDTNFCASTFPEVLAPSNDGSKPGNAYAGPPLTVNGELNKLASNISFGHGVHAGIHWRSDTTTSIELGEQMAISLLRDLARTYNEKFTIKLERVNGSMVTIGN